MVLHRRLVPQDRVDAVGIQFQVFVLLAVLVADIDSSRYNLTVEEYDIDVHFQWCDDPKITYCADHFAIQVMFFDDILDIIIKYVQVDCHVCRVKCFQLLRFKTYYFYSRLCFKCV